MRKINFTEPADDHWKDWRARCGDATNNLVAAVAGGAKAQFSDALYKEKKAVYMDLDGPFYGKCAYCESLIAADQPGDVDHYRPKARVTVNNYSTVSVA